MDTSPLSAAHDLRYRYPDRGNTQSGRGRPMLLLLIAAKRNLPRLHEDWRISEISSSKTAAETGPRNRVLKSFPTRLPWPNRLR